MGTPEPCDFQVGAPEIGPFEVSVPELPPAKVRSPQVQMRIFRRLGQPCFAGRADRQFAFRRRSTSKDRQDGLNVRTGISALATIQSWVNLSDSRRYAERYVARTRLALP